MILVLDCERLKEGMRSGEESLYPQLITVFFYQLSVYYGLVCFVIKLIEDLLTV